MGRDTGEQDTRADAFDVEKLTGIDDPAEPVYRDDHHRMIPDHPRPRYKRQCADAYGNRRRGHDPLDPFMNCQGEPETYGDDPKKFAVWKRLTLIAKDHAVRLHHYRADKVAALIDREIIPQVRKLLRGAVPHEQVESMIGEFVELLWNEVEKVT